MFNSNTSREDEKKEIDLLILARANEKCGLVEIHLRYVGHIVHDAVEAFLFTRQFVQEQQ